MSACHVGTVSARMVESMRYPLVKNALCPVDQNQPEEELSAENERLQKLALDLTIRVARLRSQAGQQVDPDSIPGGLFAKRTPQSLH
jgi:hypothetical protein